MRSPSITQRKRSQEYPVKGKHLVNTDAHHRVLHPHDDPIADQCLCKEDQDREEGTDLLEAKEAISAEEKDAPDAAKGHGMQQFTRIKHPELHAGIFRVVTSDQF